MKVKLEEVCYILDSQRIPITASDRSKGIYPYYGANGIQDYVDDYIFDDELVLLAEDGGNFGSTDKPIAYRVSGKCWVNNHAHVLKAKDCIDTDYLCYSLMFYNTDGLVNGATRQKLTQKAMRQMTIPLCNREKQQSIVATLKKVFLLIDCLNQLSCKLDELIKSRFVEMFGSIDFISFKLKEVCSKITDGTHKTPRYQNDGVTFISAKNIVNNQLDFDDVKYISEQEYKEIQRRCQVEKYDVLLSKSGSLGSAAIVNTDEPLGLFESLAVIKYDREILNPTFLCEQLKTDDIQRQFKYGTKGIAIKHLHLNVIGETKVIVPPLELQNQFADFVTKVEKQKATVQQSIDKLETLKKSLMQEYFG